MCHALPGGKGATEKDMAPLKNLLGIMASREKRLCMIDFLVFPLNICYICNQTNLNVELGENTLLNAKSKMSNDMYNVLCFM